MENKQTEIEQAKAILKQHGYYVGNLWSTQDVTDYYNCTDEQAQEVLNTVLSSEGIMEQINIDISFECSWLNIELKEDDEVSCDNCGSTNIAKNSSGDVSCTNCGWEENEN